MKLNNFRLTVFLIIAIVIVINLLADHFYFRLDFTEDHQYTLSAATKDILRNLKEPVTVKAYFSKDLPAPYLKTRSDFQEMLIEYGRISGNMLAYEFINPNDDEQKETDAMQNGIQPLMINVREKDQMTQQKAYMGAILNIGDNKEVIPVIEPGSAMEYALSTSIKKLSVSEKPSVGLLQGHGEPSIDQLMQVSTELSILYNVEPLTLTDSTLIPSRIRTIALVRPTDTIREYELKQLDDFLAGGGRLFIAMNRVSGNLQEGYGSPVYTGLEIWLAGKGLVIEENFVIDANCASVTMQQQIGNAIHVSSLAVPYIPLLSNFADHPITSGLEILVMQFVSSMQYTGDTTMVYTPLLFSSEKSGTQMAPQYFNYQKRWTEADFPLQKLVVGAALQGSPGSSFLGKMVVIADGDFPVNGPRGQEQQVHEDNVNLLVNSIDWLSDDTGLISLRTKGISARPIKEMEEGKRTFLKWLNFLFPVLLVIIYGYVRFQMRRNQRVARMETNFS